MKFAIKHQIADRKTLIKNNFMDYVTTTQRTISLICLYYVNIAYDMDSCLLVLFLDYGNSQSIKVNGTFDLNLEMNNLP